MTPIREWTLWDKGIFALLVAVIAGVTVLGVNSCTERDRQADVKEMEKHRQADVENLEKYKLAEARRRFFMEKRLDALTSIASSMSAVTKVYFGNTIDGTVAKGAERDYKLALENARETLNRNEPFFDEAFNKDMGWYFELHRAVSRAGIDKCVQYCDFISDIETQTGRLFEAMFRNLEKNGEVGSVSPSLRITLKPIPFAERSRMPPEDYIKAHYEYWKAKKKS
jgi:hypothetical protein